MADLTPYSTVTPYISDFQPWVPEADQARIAAYMQYEKFYWNAPDAFKLQQRGADDKPVYVPNGMTVVDVTAHYLLKGLSIEFAIPNDQQDADLRAFMDREAFLAKFHIAKHSGVVRGDWAMHITADPNKPEGRRISVNSVDPAAVFPEFDPDDLDRIIGMKLAEPFTDDDGETRIRRLRYTYETVGGARVVVREEAIFELDDWGGPDSKPVRVLTPAGQLPGDITTIPLYLFQNRPWQGDPFGASELKGFERLMAAVNQAVSDEGLALALEGLGVYATDAPPPTDSNGDEVPWVIGPGRVVELPGGKKMNRVAGVGSVTPSLDHIEYLENSLWQGAGITDIARGAVDVTTAESGVALAIKFMPTLAKLEARDMLGLARVKQMMFDWKAWHKAYEGPDYLASEIVVNLGPKLPQDNAARFEQLRNMLADQVISRRYFRSEARKLGWVFPEDEELEQEIILEQQKIMEANDLAGNRVEQGAEGADLQ